MVFSGTIWLYTVDLFTLHPLIQWSEWYVLNLDYDAFLASIWLNNTNKKEYILIKYWNNISSLGWRHVRNIYFLHGRRFLPMEKIFTRGESYFQRAISLPKRSEGRGNLPEGKYFQCIAMDLAQHGRFHQESLRHTLLPGGRDHKRGGRVKIIQEPVVMLCYIDCWDIPSSELQWCSWLSERWQHKSMRCSLYLTLDQQVVFSVARITGVANLPPKDVV